MRQEECVAMIKRSFMVNIDWKSLPKLGTAQYTFLSNGVQTHIVYAHFWRVVYAIFKSEMRMQELWTTLNRADIMRLIILSRAYL